MITNYEQEIQDLTKDRDMLIKELFQAQQTILLPGQTRTADEKKEQTSLILLAI